MNFCIYCTFLACLGVTQPICEAKIHQTCHGDLEVCFVAQLQRFLYLTCERDFQEHGRQDDSHQDEFTHCGVISMRCNVEKVKYFTAGFDFLQLLFWNLAKVIVLLPPLPRSRLT